MRTDLFDFELPADRIALRPVSPRDAARLLVVRPSASPEFEDRSVKDLADLLTPGDALVVNDTRVIPVRLSGRRTGRGLRGGLSPAMAGLMVKVSRPSAASDRDSENTAALAEA